MKRENEWNELECSVFFYSFNNKKKVKKDEKIFSGKFFPFVEKNKKRSGKLLGRNFPKRRGLLGNIVLTSFLEKMTKKKTKKEKKEKKKSGNFFSIFVIFFWIEAFSCCGIGRENEGQITVNFRDY